MRSGEALEVLNAELSRLSRLRLLVYTLMRSLRSVACLIQAEHKNESL